MVDRTWVVRKRVVASKDIVAFVVLPPANDAYMPDNLLESTCVTPVVDKKSCKDRSRVVVACGHDCSRVLALMPLRWVNPGSETCCKVVVSERSCRMDTTVYLLQLTCRPYDLAQGVVEMGRRVGIVWLKVFDVLLALDQAVKRMLAATVVVHTVVGIDSRTGEDTKQQ